MASGINSTPALVIVIGIAASPAIAGMERLDDSEMSNVSGQSGVTLEMESQVSIDTVSYFTNDSGIHLDDVSVGSASSAGEGDFRVYDLDLLDGGILDIGFDIRDQRMCSARRQRRKHGRLLAGPGYERELPDRAWHRR